MEANMEMVEKLVNKTGVSYTEAKRTLEQTDWDILEALIKLEGEGKIKNSTAEFSTRKGDGEDEYSCHKDRKEKKDKKSCQTGENFKSTGKSLCDTLKDVFDKGNTNSIEAYRNDEKKLGMPVNVFVLLLILGFWIVIPLMIVGLFFGYHYSFSGKELGKESVNNAMGKANDFADSIKSEIKNEINKEKNDN